MRVGSADILLLLRTSTHRYEILICLFSSLISFLRCVVLFIKILPVVLSVMPTYSTLGHAGINACSSLQYPARMFSLLPLLLLPELVPAGPSGSVHSVTLFGKSGNVLLCHSYLHGSLHFLSTEHRCYSVLWKYGTDTSLVLSKKLYLSGGGGSKD